MNGEPPGGLAAVRGRDPVRHSPFGMWLAASALRMVGIPFLAAAVLVAGLFVLQGRLRLDSLFASERRDRQEVADEIDVLLAVNHRLVGVLQAAFARDPPPDPLTGKPDFRRADAFLAGAGPAQWDLAAVASPLLPQDGPNLISAAAPLPAGSAFVRPDAEAYRKELQAALEAGPLMRDVHAAAGGRGSVYYISRAGFLLVYPWLDAGQHPDLLERVPANPFFDVALSHAGKRDSHYLSPVYDDLAGKGLMTTLALPVLRDGKVAGAVSIDLVLTEFNRLLAGRQPEVGVRYLVDGAGKLLAHPTALEGASGAVSEAEVLPRELRKRWRRQAVRGDENLAGLRISWRGITGTDWTLVELTPWNDLVGRMLAGLALPLSGASAALFGLFLLTFRIVARLLKAQDALARELRRLAATDDLTKLPNRRHFLEQANAALQSAAAADERVAVIMLDVDRFKGINDRFGHGAGDTVLRAIGARLAETVRGQDLVGRLGGEEFGALILGADAGMATAVAERMRAAVEEAAVFVPGGPTLRVTISAGVCARQASDCGLLDLLERADAALYEAKHGGRNCVRIANIGGWGRKNAPCGRGHKGAQNPRPLEEASDDATHH